MPAKIQIVGVLNVTPDSFSDGGRYCSDDRAIQHAEKLIGDGADIIDVGADSTRPGSICVGPHEELRRLESLLSSWPTSVPFSVDTHHSNVAAFALEKGALMINDVSAGFDPEMFSVMKGSPASYVMMYSRCPSPHIFSPEAEGDILENVKRFFNEKIESALQGGLSDDQIVLDPGMGGFISVDPEKSWRVIRNFSAFEEYGYPLYFGSSRKGFLKLPLEGDVEERDYLSTLTGRMVRDQLSDSTLCYIRVHNVKDQVPMLCG